MAQARAGEGGIDGAVTIVEQKIFRLNGEPTVKKYVKQKQLGQGGFAKCFEFKH